MTDLIAFAPWVILNLLWLAVIFMQIREAYILKDIFMPNTYKPKVIVRCPKCLWEGKRAHIAKKCPKCGHWYPHTVKNRIVKNEPI